MKFRMPLSFVGLLVVGSAVSCFTWAQEQRNLFRSSTGTTSASPLGGTVSVSQPSAQSIASVYNSSTDGTSNIEVASLLQKYSAATADSDKKELVSQLGDAVAKQFDARQEAKLQELQKLEEQLVKLKDLHAKRAQQKDRIVNDRVQQLILEADGLGWGTSDGNRSWGFGYTTYQNQFDQFAPAAARAQGTRSATGPAVMAPASGLQRSLPQGQTTTAGPR